MQGSASMTIADPARLEPFLQPVGDLLASSCTWGR
jgi:hypothetical protein